MNHFALHAIAAKVLQSLEAEIVSRGLPLGALKASSEEYGREIAKAVADYFKRGVRSRFTSMMRNAIVFGLRDAFDLGAADVGISSEDYTRQDRTLRDEIIDEELTHVPDLLDFLDGIANDPNAHFSDANYRVDLWKKRFDDMRSRAKVILGKDAKGEWVVDPVKEHCPSCLKLNGIVKRWSFWQEHGVLPKAPPNPMLECGGYQCGCDIKPTDKPISRGRLPNLP